MKNWFDLNKDERKLLKNEFNSKKRKIIDLRIFLYLLAGISFFIFFIPLVLKINNQCNMKEMCNNTMLIFGLLTFIFLCMAILNSTMLSKHQKEFEKWLKARNIEK